MSLEGLLLLLALFILLPLIERMLRAARRPDGDTADQGADVPRTASRPSIPPPMPQRQPTDARVPPPGDIPPVPARPAPRRSPRPPRAAAGAPRALRSGGRVEELRSPLALRHAVVLTTILGPCRAVAPYEWERASGATGQG